MLGFILFIIALNIFIAKSKEDDGGKTTEDGNFVADFVKYGAMAIFAFFYMIYAVIVTAVMTPIKLAVKYLKKAEA